MLKLSPLQRFYTRRFTWYVITFMVAITLNFILPRMRTVSPVDMIMLKQNNRGLTQEEVAEKRQQIEAQFHLDKPIFMQYVLYIRDIMTLDFGYSILNYPQKVWDLIKGNILWTLVLQIPAIVLGYLIGNMLGVLAVYRRGIYNTVFYPLSLFFTAIPYFCVGLMLVYFFAIKLQWFPPMGGYSDSVALAWTPEFILSAGAHFVLPFLSLFLVMMGGQAIGMRSMSMYEIGTDYVKYSKQLGMSDARIVRYVFRNAILPQLTGLALAMGVMVSGALLIEIIFSYPGIGSVLYDAVQQNDYPVLQAGALLVTVNVLVFNFLVDVMIAIFDPRIKASVERG